MQNQVDLTDDGHPASRISLTLECPTNLLLTASETCPSGECHLDNAKAVDLTDDAIQQICYLSNLGNAQQTLVEPPRSVDYRSEDKAVANGGNTARSQNYKGVMSVNSTMY